MLGNVSSLLYESPSNSASFISENFKKMDVVVARDCSVTGPKELLGPKGDQYITDANFTAWLTRMLDTEGYPLVPGKRELWRSGLKRIK